MPFSAVEGKQFFVEWLKLFGTDRKPFRILDLGAGAGRYGELCSEVGLDIFTHAVEVYEPYIEQFSLREKYNKVSICDMRKLVLNEIYDLVILGDSLEHISCSDGTKLFKYLKSKARFIWLCMPIVPFRPWFYGYKQPESEWEDNPAEQHRCEWTWDSMNKNLGPFLWSVPFKTVVVMIAEGVNAD